MHYLRKILKFDLLKNNQKMAVLDQTNKNVKIPNIAS
jgi:hypothetical protein